ncbi:MAG TPA: flagellar biosynthetic protein FliO [Solirubrobacteraceae bacterium]|jgi:flagellar protein FliO/FliZ
MTSLSRALAAAITCCLILPAAAFAADGEQTPLDLTEQPVRAAGSAPGAGGGGLVRTIVGLAVVIGVIYGISWVLRQVKASREEKSSGAGLAPLATLPLGPNRSLHLIRAGSELVLVGAGEHGVTPIRTYSEGEARALGLLEGGDDGDGDGGAPASRAGAALKVSKLMNDLRARTVLR